MAEILFGMRNGRSHLRRIIFLIGLGLTFFTHVIVAAERSAPETQISILLNCAVIIANTEGDITRYDKYVIAASYLAVDNGKSMEWLNKRIERAAETAYDFAGEEGAAERCVHTLRSAEDLLR